MYIAVFFSIRVLNSLKEMDTSNFLFVPLQNQTCDFENGGKIIISKIGVEAPLIMPENDGQYIDDLDRGVTHYPDSPLPGQEGLSELLGHSAPVGWPDTNYDRVFSNLVDLKEGDEVVIDYGGCDLKYRVKETIYMDKGEEIPNLTKNGESAIVLISCWPPGKDYRRIGVVAEIVD